MDAGSRSLSLFELGEHAANIESLLEREGDDEEMQGALNEALTSLMASIETKIDGYASLIRKYEALGKMADDEAARIAQFGAGFKGKAALLKERLKTFMELHEKDVIQGNTTKIWLQNNGGAEPLYVDPEFEKDPTKLPKQFQMTTISPDREAIRAALAAGVKVDGCGITPRGRHMRMK